MVNFIRHFRAWMALQAEDDRLSPHHVSLYLALFQFWNLNHFRNPLSISREETMRLSKIGSVNTYLKCLKELHQWNYIRYEPSYNPVRGSKVHLYRFDKAQDVGDGKAGDTTGDDAQIQAVSPSINVSNKLNIQNKLNAYEQAHENSDLSLSRREEQKKEADLKPGDPVNRGSAIPQTPEEAEAFFVEERSSALEAEKFFNYFQSNGWKVGGRAPMKDWKAAARNWILNAQKFAHERSTHQHSGILNASRDKDFGEPL